jgi:hypothetical protein
MTVGVGALSQRLTRMQHSIEEPAAAGVGAPARGFRRRAGTLPTHCLKAARLASFTVVLKRNCGASARLSMTA